jgi:hypothetical protein
MAKFERSNELDAAAISGAVAALEKRAKALREKAALGVSVVTGEFGEATVVSSEAAAALKLAGDFEEIARDLRESAT